MRHSIFISTLLLAIDVALVPADTAPAQPAPDRERAGSYLLPFAAPVALEPSGSTELPDKFNGQATLVERLPAYPSYSLSQLVTHASPTDVPLQSQAEVAAASYWRSAGCLTCDSDPRHSLNVFLGYDSWRGLPDGDWGHNGLHTGLNYGTRLGQLSELTGIGFQVGASAGVYDFSGAAYHMRHTDQSQVQGFLTHGFFRHATDKCPWSGAIVQDWMFNHNYSEFAEDPILGQLRGQIGYVLDDHNEVGLWGSVRDKSDSRTEPVFGETRWRAINEISVFWHHKWDFGGDTVLGIGIPEHKRMEGNGSLGDYIATATANVPLNDHTALYTLISYMHPSAAPGFPGSSEDTWAFMIGVSYYPSYNARSSNVRGQCWSPLLPIANNGSFLVDTNNFY